MASKDITKVAVAGTAVVGLVLIYYLFTKKSKSQGADKKQGNKTKESSPVNKPQPQSEEKQEAEKKPEPVQSKPKPESKIPQKIPSKPQGVVKPSLSEGSSAVTKPESVPNQEDIKAGGETIPVVKKDQSKDVKPQDREIQNNEPVTKPEISSTKPKEQIEKKKEPTPPPVAAVQPVQQQQPIQASAPQPASVPVQQPASVPVQQPASVPVPQPASVPVQQPASVPVQQPASVPVPQPASVPVPQPASVPVQQAASVPVQQPASVPVQPEQQQPSNQQHHPSQEAEKPVYNADDSEEVSIKSEASITLSSPVSQPTDSPRNTTLTTDSPVVENGTGSHGNNGQNGIEAPPQAASKPGLDAERINAAVQLATSSPASLDKETIDTLVMLLRQKDIPLLQTALDCIVRCGAFSQNQTLLRESGCIQELTILLEIHAVAARTGAVTSQNLLGSLNNAIINLCMDIQNQARLEVCIPVLIDLITYQQSPDDVQLMSLKSLTNLSTTPSYHEQYIVAIPRLYSMMDGLNSSIRLQAVKVLVNLSCNPEIIPDLLEAKTPRSMLKCLEPQTDSILLLRVVTLLVNLVSCVKEGKVTEEQLPALDNPAYDGSIHMTLFGDNESTELKMRVQSLTRHSTDNVSKQAIRLMEYIK